jgi:hypothetical protein
MRHYVFCILLYVFKGVRRKLCALSLTARAFHGELPLPMPAILRRPTHMIIVTGMPNNAIGHVNNESSDEEFSNLRVNRKNVSTSSVRFNSHGTASSSRVNISRGASRNGVGNRDEHLNLMAETKFRASPRVPRTPR